MTYLVRFVTQSYRRIRSKPTLAEGRANPMESLHYRHFQQTLKYHLVNVDLSLRQYHGCQGRCVGYYGQIVLGYYRLDSRGALSVYEVHAENGDFSNVSCLSGGGTGAY